MSCAGWLGSHVARWGPAHDLRLRGIARQWAQRLPHGVCLHPHGQVTAIRTIATGWGIRLFHCNHGVRQPAGKNRRASVTPHHTHIRNPGFASAVVHAIGDDIRNKVVIDYRPGWGVLSDALLSAGASELVAIVKERGNDGWIRGKHYGDELNVLAATYSSVRMYSGCLFHLDSDFIRPPMSNRNQDLRPMPFSEYLMCNVPRSNWESDDCKAALITLLPGIGPPKSGCDHASKFITQLLYWINRRDRIYYWGRVDAYILLSRIFGENYLLSKDFARKSLLANSVCDVDVLGEFDASAMIDNSRVECKMLVDNKSKYDDDILLLRLRPKKFPPLTVDLEYLARMTAGYHLGRGKKTGHNKEQGHRRTMFDILERVCLNGGTILDEQGINRTTFPEQLSPQQHYTLANLLAQHEYAPEPSMQ